MSANINQNVDTNGSESADDLAPTATLCDRCTAVVDRVHLVAGAHWCEECLDNHSCTCERCGSVVDSDECAAVGDETWCDHCTGYHSFRCDDCGDRFPDREQNGVASGNVVCNSCLGEYTECRSCSDLYPNDDIDSDGNCPGCESHTIRPHDADVVDILDPVFDRKSRNLGVELEVESTALDSEECAEECLRIIGEDFAIAKSDGSLRDCGFELVSVPAPLGVQIDRWAKLLRNPPRGLRSWDTDGRCGLHVHATRRSMTQFTIAKLLVFVNNPDNSGLVEAIAGRGSTQYCHKYRKTAGDVRRPYSRYEAVNLQNRNTVEIRIFRGTLKLESFCRCLEFADAACDFAAHVGFRQLTPDDFCKWAEGRRKTYPHLVAFLASRNLVAARPARARKGGDC